MYKEDNEKTVSFKSLIFKVILVILLIFALMMLFPTRGFLTNYVDSRLGEDQSVSNFNNNLLTMATVASGYYTASRLPENTGDKVSMTLGDMLENKMLVRLKDTEGNACDSKKSYVEVTKEEDEYTMRVNLSCGGEEDYIISHMGLDGTSFPSTSTARCEFVKNLDGTWSYGKWSSWSTKKVTETSDRQVQTKTKKVKSGVKSVPEYHVEEKNATRYIINGQKVVYVCATGYDNAGTYDYSLKCTKTTTTYKEEPVYKNVTYYRYRTKTQNASQTDTKWSSCDDEDLLNQGYTLTGKRE